MGDSVRDLAQGTVLQLFLHSEKIYKERQISRCSKRTSWNVIAQLIYSVKYAHFWDFTQRKIVICYWRFGATYRLSRNVCNKLPFYAA